MTLIRNTAGTEAYSADDEMKQKKKALRREIRALRAAHSDEEIHAMSLKVLEQVKALPEYQEAETLFVYVDCKHETETSDLIRQAWADGKKTAVPKVIGEAMKFFYITSLEDDLEAVSYTHLPPLTRQRESQTARAAQSTEPQEAPLARALALWPAFFSL